MRFTLSGLSLIAFLAVVGPLAAQPKPTDPPADFAQPQSAPKPIPNGLKIIDYGTIDPAFKGYMIPEGFKLEVVANEPAVINPVGMTFGPDGTFYCLEWVPSAGDDWHEKPELMKYKDGSTRNIATMWKKKLDVLKVLKFNPKSKTYDKAELLLEDQLPSSILIHDGWIYLSSRGTVRRYRQSKEGGPYDVKEVIAQGFCGFHHHQVSGMTIGLDGWLYITSGDDDNYVEGVDGSRATVLRTGAVFRCRPDGSKMQTYSIGWRNPYRDMAFDKNFNWFHSDNDNEDGSKFTGCRLMHVAEGTDFGWRLFVGARCCKPDPVRGAVAGELPGKVPPLIKTGRGSPAGLLIYNDTRLPEFYRGWLYYPDVFRKLIRAYQVEKHGSTFEIVNEFELLKSDDPLFRPCQMVTGPDGAIYIVDWRTDSGGAGKLWGDGIHGRIYRLTWAGGKVPGATDSIPAIEPRPLDSWQKLLALDDAALIKAINSPDLSDRLIVANELRKRGDKNREALLKIAADEEQPLDGRLIALGVLHSLWNDAVEKTFTERLSDKSAEVRRIVADGLALLGTRGSKELHAALAQRIVDPELPVRRSIFLAIAAINSPLAADTLVNCLRADDHSDYLVTDGIARSLERCGKLAMLKLIDMANSGVDADRNLVVAAFLGFRERAAIETVPELLLNEHLSTSQRLALVKSFTNYQLEPAVNYDGLLDLLASRGEGNPALQQVVMEVLADSGSLKGPKAVNLATGLLGSDKPEIRLAALKAIEVARLNEAAPKLVKMLGNAAAEPNELIATIKTLRVLNDRSATVPLQAIVAAEVPVIVRVEALRSLATLDAKSAIEAATKFLDQSEPTLQTEAVLVLGTTPEGAKLVADRFIAKKISRDLLPQVSDALRRHAAKHPEFNQMLTEVMKGGLLVSLEPAQLEKMRQVVATKGDPKRGKLIYFNTKQLACMNCHKMEGIGGNVGPDLTRLWDTATIEKIMESIIEPSKEIKEGYQSYTITTKEGKTISGLKISDKPTEVVLRDATGRDTRVARDDIEQIAASKLSLMPDNVISQLSYDQFIDLIAFLKNRQSQESLRGFITEVQAVGPFPGEHQPVYGPESKPEATEAYALLGGKTGTWQPLLAQTNGYFDLAAAYPGPKHAVYIKATINATESGKVKLVLGVDGSAKIWLNGSMINDRNQPLGDPVNADTQTIELDLKQGANLLMIKSVAKPDRHGLYLRIEPRQ